MGKKLAHSHPSGNHQTLEEHSLNVARRASRHGSKFDDGVIMHALGLLHDAGKATAYFQRRLLGDVTATAHARHPRLGAKAALRHYGEGTYSHFNPLVYCTEHHHSGLKDAASFVERLRDPIDAQWVAETEHHLEESSFEWPIFTRSSKNVGILMRMRMSSLIDADWGDTADFYGNTIQHTHDAISTLKSLSQDYYQANFSTVISTPLNAIRSAFYREAMTHVRARKGFFSLEGDTGTGKTLLHARFAIEHAAHHNMDRIILLAPYIAITEQNAPVYRSLFGSNSVTESHSSIDWESMEDTAKYRHLMDTWEAPVIVSTTVEFFETLFSSKNRRLRKMHNICNSVIVIDEFQSIPEDRVVPAYRALQELVQEYGCTIVLSSATSPKKALQGWRETPLLPADVINLVSTPEDPMPLDRVVWHPVEDEMTWQDVAQKMSVECSTQILMITTTVKGSSNLITALSDYADAEHIYHLSTAMTPSHRSHVIAEAKTALDSGLPCYLVSTPVIQAGVDIDFPVVWRQACPYDDAVQSAGRCNRHGVRTTKGSFRIIHILDPSDINPTFQMLPNEMYMRRLGVSKKLYKDGVPYAEMRSRAEVFYQKSLTPSEDSFSGGGEHGERTWALNNTGYWGKVSPEGGDHHRFRMIDDITTQIVIPTPENADILMRATQDIPLSGQDWRDLGLTTLSVCISSDRLQDLTETHGIIRAFLPSKVYHAGKNGTGMLRHLHNHQQESQ